MDLNNLLKALHTLKSLGISLPIVIHVNGKENTSGILNEVIDLNKSKFVNGEGDDSNPRGIPGLDETNQTTITNTNQGIEETHQEILIATEMGNSADEARVTDKNQSTLNKAIVDTQVRVS